MKRILLLALTLSACSSTKIKDVQVGMSESEVQALVGEPKSESQKGSAKSWQVTSGEQDCTLQFNEGKLTEKSCVYNEANHHKFGKAIGSIFKGTGSAMQNNRSVSCTTVQSGTIANTNCN